ncbi:sulfatase [Maribacter chungangensis]|uniref:Sulfatase n=1 Tax=Maribacter chungangensis TaxID=1069117 RepID=A0ABW3B7S6_9FLAO
MKYILLHVFVIFMGFSARAQQERPNILFVVLDDAGTDMGAYGSSYVNTPAFDEIAKAGLLFNKAYTPNAKCAPSRAAILTGRNSWQLDAAVNHLAYFPTKFKTFPEVLAAHGYAVGYTGKGWGPGIAETEDNRPRYLTGKGYNELTLTPPTAAISSNDYAGNFNMFLDEVDGTRPWSFWVGSLEPHRGYEFNSGVSLGNKKPEMITDFPNYWPDTEVVRKDLLDYAYEIEYMDRQVKLILDMLKDKKMMENTLIVYTSDHGMPFPRVKGNQYETSNHIPLAISWGNKIVARGSVINDFISFIDIAPTILEAANIPWAKSEMQPFTGKSLFEYFTSDANNLNKGRNFVLVGKERHDTGRPNDVGYPIRGVYKDSMLYLKNYEPQRWPSGNPETGYLNTDGSPTKTLLLNQRRSGENYDFWKMNFGKRPTEELYNLLQDPFCVENLANDMDWLATKTYLQSFMEAKLKEQGDWRVSGYGFLYEQFPMTNGNGFYDAFFKGVKPNTGWVSDSDFEGFFITDDGKNDGPVSIPGDQ